MKGSFVHFCFFLHLSLNTRSLSFVHFPLSSLPFNTTYLPLLSITDHRQHRRPPPTSQYLSSLSLSPVLVVIWPSPPQFSVVVSPSHHHHRRFRSDTILSQPRPQNPETRARRTRKWICSFYLWCFRERGWLEVAGGSKAITFFPLLSYKSKSSVQTSASTFFFLIPSTTSSLSTNKFP